MKEVETNKIFEALGAEFKYVCEDCGVNGEFREADFKLFFETENFVCFNCFTPLLSSSESIAPIVKLLNELE
ncbi:hypothetical protein [Rufibacter sp. LB8]|uniref:hypothetical protein n=1 Tax=Rufibacter sp. LB8 TaxID=2777781 RepID=UPI00178C70F8|nr:hypothetical protein [Rufibacter sp. LB8]